MGRKGTNELISGEKPFIAILSNLKCLFSRLYIVYCAMELLLLLDIAGVASRNDAYADVVSWVHRDADEGIMCGYAAHCSINDLMKCAHVCLHLDGGTAVPAGHLSM